MTATEPPGYQRSLYFIFRDPGGHALLSHPPHISRYFAVGRTAKRSGPIRIISGVCAPTPRPTDSAGPSQGESGQKDTEDAASTMSHDITVSSQPRTRNGEQSPFRRLPSTPRRVWPRTPLVPTTSCPLGTSARSGWRRTASTSTVTMASSRRIADVCASRLLVSDNHGYRLPAASQTARSSISSSSLPLVSGTRKKTKMRDSSAKTA